MGVVKTSAKLLLVSLLALGITVTVTDHHNAQPIVEIEMVQEAVAGVGIRSVQIIPSPDGVLYSQFPGGDAPPDDADLTWDIADALVTAGWDNLLVGTSKDTDLRQYLSGAASASANSTLSLSPVSGTVPATAGITITSDCGTGAGSCLSYDGIGTGAGTFRAVATTVVGGNAVNSAVKSFTITDPVGPPGQTTGLAANVVSSSRIDITWTATPGATTYDAERNGAVICNDTVNTSCSHTGLTADTQYSFTVVPANGAGVGTESDPLLASTPPISGGTFDPDYPRLYLRQAYSNMGTLEPESNIADFNTATAWVAKYHASMGGSGRTKTYAGGQINAANIMQTVKAHDNYDDVTGSAHCKYTNVTQLSAYSQDQTDEQGRNKALAESNGPGDWFLRSTTGVQTVDPGNAANGSGSKYKMNYTRFPDADHNGHKWMEWYARWEFSATTDDKDGFTGNNYGTGNDFVGKNGKGLRESAYDCVFEDDMAMLQNDPKVWMDGKDFDEDGSADFVTDTDVKNAMSGGFIDLAAAWRELFPTQSPRTLQYVIGNITSMTSWNDYWPVDLRGVYQGGLVEEFSGKLKSQNFGNLTTNDSAIQPYTGILGQYKRAMEFTASPRIVAMGHEPEPEWRTKWGCKPGALEATCGGVTKANNWVSKGGSCSAAEGQAGSAAECKYPGRRQDFSDYRLMRWALAFVMMDDGFFSTNQTTSHTWNTGLPWYDEYVGGEQVNQVGWCGQPVAGPSGAAQYTSFEQGVHRREFENCIVYQNPGRSDPTVDHTKTGIDVPAAGSGFRWKRLCATPGGFTTDGSSGTQDATTNNGDWVGAANTATTISIDEIEGVFLWRAPVATPDGCP